MQKPFVVGFAGKMHTGKSTLATALVAKLRERGHTAWVYGFAVPIKQSLALIGITKEDTPVLYRLAAQALGAACRAYDPNFWVNLWLRKRPRSKFVIVDDLRYPNEKELMNLSFKIVSKPHKPATGDANHESEQLVFDCDVDIDNHSHQVDSVVESLIPRILQKKGQPPHAA